MEPGLSGRADLHVTADSATWLGFLRRDRGLLWALLRGRIRLWASPSLLRRLRLMATIADPRVIARILAHLGLPLEPPCPVPARRPGWLPAAAS